MTESHRTETDTDRGRRDPHAAKVKEEARKTGQTLKEEARRTGDAIKREARRTASEGKNRAADEIDDVGHAAERSAEAFRQEGRPEIGEAIHSVAEGMESFARKLRNKDFDQLLEEGRDAARDNPLLFYGAAATAGFLCARIMTASRPRQEPDYYTAPRPTGRPYGADTAGTGAPPRRAKTSTPRRDSTTPSRSTPAGATSSRTAGTSTTTASRSPDLGSEPKPGTSKRSRTGNGGSLSSSGSDKTGGSKS